MSWIIKGQSGFKVGSTPWALDATARSLADLNITGASLKFQSLAYDTLVWTAVTADATGAGTIVPDFGQTVELWWDTTRKFIGHVTGVTMAAKQIQITVDGPWWWLERTNLTEVVTDATGATAERHTYVFPLQSLATSIGTLIARSITNGVPMTAGSVATMFTAPQMTLSEQSCANALATLMSWCPDSVAWFDYSGSGTPVLNVTRRGVVSTITYTVASDLVEIGDITPRLDLEVASNELHYVVRDATTGKPAWASQVSGTAVAGKRQIVTVSGPEIVDFLPKDDFESYVIQTAATYYSDATAAARDSVLQNIAKTWGVPGGLAASISYYVTDPSGQGYNGRMAQTRTFTPLTILDSTGAAVPSLAGKKLILTATPPAWAMTLLGAVNVTVSGTWIATNTVGTYTPAEQALQSGGFGFIAGWVGASGGTMLYVSGRTFTFTGVLVSAAYLASTTLYKPWEYTFAVPPTGLAAALQAAQSWVPWEGPITLVADECSGANLLPNKFNLANALAPCASMAALAKDVVHDLMRGRTTIDLGAPARVDFGTLVSRVKAQPQDTIVYL